MKREIMNALKAKLLKISGGLIIIMGAVIIGASTPFLINPKPALAECNSFGTCTWIERRVHCKGWRGCTLQYRMCSKFGGYGNLPPTPQRCGDWKNSL